MFALDSTPPFCDACVLQSYRPGNNEDQEGGEDNAAWDEAEGEGARVGTVPQNKVRMGGLGKRNKARANAN